MQSTTDFDAQIERKQKQLQILIKAKQNPAILYLLQQNQSLKKQLQTLQKSQPIYGKSNSWQTYISGVVTSVKYPHLKLTKTPLIFTSLHGTSSIWTTTGATSVYSASKDGFLVYVNNIGKEDMVKYNGVLHYQLIPQE